jgi:hypothetical protein
MRKESEKELLRVNKTKQKKKKERTIINQKKKQTKVFCSKQ